METHCLKRQVLYLVYLLFICDITFGAIRSIRKICKSSEIELLSNQGVRIEPVDRSHVHLILVDPSSFKSHRTKLNKTIRIVENLINVLKTRPFVLDFEFKTTEPNGVLFYSVPQGKHDQSIALILENGNLKYKIKCPTLHADIYIPTRNMTQLNDGRWHSVSYSVRFKRHGRRGFITIDDFTNPKRYEVSCDYMESLIMGGVSPLHRGNVRELESIPGHFDGCIRNVRIPTALRSPPKYYAVSVCD